MSYIAVRHSNRIIRSASLKYPDAGTRSATKTGRNNYAYSANSLRDDAASLDVTRAADELPSSSAQPSKYKHQTR
eukprot:6134713-Pyramimonas_sp.AAC.1